MKTYAIIGSNCFTGSHVVDALLERPDAKVIGVGRSPEVDELLRPYARHGRSRFAFHQVDVLREPERLAALLDGEKPQVIVWAAALSEVALSLERPLEYFATNTEAVVRAADHVRRAGWLQRWVHVSTAEVYGHCGLAKPEDAPLDPSTPYAASKAAADLYLGTLVKNFGFPAVLIRSTNVYGPRQQLHKIIPRAVVHLKLGRPIELHGGGLAVKAFIHVKDVVRGLLAAAEDKTPGVRHFTVSGSFTVADVVDRVCRLMGADFAKATSPGPERPGQDARYWLDGSRTEDDLGWKPAVSLEDGLNEVVSWVEENWDAVRKQPLEYRHKP